MKRQREALYLRALGAVLSGDMERLTAALSPGD